MSMPAPGPNRIARSVLSDETYFVIRDMLLDHRIAPGQRVNIEALAADLGVSPTPVREALARLESDGLVVKTPLRGYSSTQLLGVREFTELSQFRDLIEPWTAAQAARSIDEAGIEAIRDELANARAAILREADGAGSYAALTEHDARFHSLIARLAGNELMVQAFERTHFHLHFLRLYMASLAQTSRPEDEARLIANAFGDYYRSDGGSLALDEHTAIAEAIIEHRAEDAARLIREHIESSQRRFEPVVALLEREG
ncbi:DNA-binding transcriptional regulator, GntR family [Microterricola viridarii]|uniref:DNA-binding transcriptional regulator, GntR family n=2 Tax=Microterricola viridarii TaxID=412690 RepID=A0A1H1NYZ4_9MICO|nr:DNA-binding transcriptional regulator, GntR family [Microterricola viridarii]